MRSRQQRLLGRLALAFFVLLAMAAAIEIQPDADDGEEDWSLALDSFDIEDVTALEIQTMTARHELERTHGDWRIVATPSPIADQRKISNVLDILRRAKAGPSLDVRPSAEFGLAPPRESITVHFQGDAKQRIDIGAHSPVGQHTYILVDGQVRTTQFRLDLQLDGSPHEMRAREVIHLSRTSVTGLELELPGVALSLVKLDEAWWLTTDHGLIRANPEAIDSVLSTLLDLRVDRFEAEVADAIPTLRVTVSLDEGSLVLDAWKFAADDWRARSDLHQGFLAITPGLTTVENLGQVDLAFQRLLPVHLATLTRIEVRLPGIQFEANRSEDGWSDPRTTGLLAALDTVPVDRTHPVETGTEPVGEIVLVEEGQRTLRLDLYTHAFGLVGTENGKGLPFLVSADAVQALQEALVAE